jgi:5-formyltetrahydrofolate cyclo-ligase
MIPVKITTLEKGLKSDVKGLRVPITGVPVPIGDIDLVVAPGLGFDKRGNRLGRGGSYYDRFFASERLRAARCGIGFAGQLVDEVPVTDHDVPVDFVVTDEGVCYCNDEAGEDFDRRKQGS